MSLGLYLHIPYCFSKCRYCDFYSAPGQRGVPRAYVDALLRELSRFAPDAPLRPDTLYFGGGTPSLLDPADAARLIAAAQPLPGAEITLEANPETVTEDSLRAFREAGVNRISFGVQSARDSQLKTLGRPHTAKQARAAFAAARRAGFENISGDIMLALPHYTQAEFDETLELIEDGGAAHISAYLLKIEPDSAFGRTPPEGLPTSDEAADFYLYAVEQLEHHVGHPVIDDTFSDDCAFFQAVKGRRIIFVIHNTKRRIICNRENLLCLTLVHLLAFDHFCTILSYWRGLERPTPQQSSY